jgi:hypothetical protein
MWRGCGGGGLILQYSKAGWGGTNLNTNSSFVSSSSSSWEYQDEKKRKKETRLHQKKDEKQDKEHQDFRQQSRKHTARPFFSPFFHTTVSTQPTTFSRALSLCLSFPLPLSHSSLSPPRPTLSPSLSRFPQPMMKTRGQGYVILRFLSALTSLLFRTALPWCPLKPDSFRFGGFMIWESPVRSRRV